MHEAERQRDQADPPQTRLSMPAAELFGIWAVAQAAAESSQSEPTAVLSVGDCQPAAAAINAATSSAAQMRSLLAGARGFTTQWLAVA
eukprot:753342-Pleurochrysis_carterae.AAC.1